MIVATTLFRVIIAMLNFKHPVAEGTVVEVLTPMAKRGHLFSIIILVLTDLSHHVDIQKLV